MCTVLTENSDVAKSKPMEISLEWKERTYECSCQKTLQLNPTLIQVLSGGFQQ